LYQYNAVVERVVDGDTIVCNVDLGFCIYVKEKFRLANINAPEVITEQGKYVRQIVTDMLTGKQIVMNVLGKDKYGRWLATIFLNNVNINEWLVTNGYAQIYT
jgi:micrococcal nuclease